VYYGKQSSSNSNYYNSYGNSSYQYRDGTDYLTAILKILVILLLLGILFVGFVFISNRTKIVENRVQRVDNQNIFKVAKEEPLEKKEELLKKIENEIIFAKDNKKSHLTQEDIANIVSIVMEKMSSCKKGSVASDDDYTKELFSQDVDRLNSSKIVVPNSINTEKLAKEDTITLSDIDHYNKIVINRPQKEEYSNNSLSKLSIELNSAIDEESNITTTNYTQAISKEIAVRSNEMRIIVVKKGDSLSKIAKRAYGSYDSYIKIFEANPEIIKNPDRIFVGQRLRIPI